MFKNKEQGRTSKFSSWKKILFLTCLAISFTFSSTALAASDELGTVYHVYMDGKHIGKVDDISVVQRIIDEKTAAGEQQFGDYEFITGNNLSFVPEKVFNPTYNNERVAQIVGSELSIKAKAVEMKIDEKTVGYFKNKEAAQQVLHTYKSEFVEEDVLEKLDTKGSEPKLSVGETAIVEVSFAKEVTLEEEKIAPQEILTVEQGVELLGKGTLEEKKHKVSEGEVLVEIASQYDLSVEKLIELNSIDEDSILHIGDELIVMEYAPFVHVVVKKQKLVEETMEYETKIIESDEMYKGEEKVKQEGKDGKKEVRYAIEITNGNKTEKRVLKENILEEPVKEIIIKGTKVIPSRGTGDLHWPTIGGYVSSHVGPRWGSMHKGMDIAGPSNRAILAADNGVVVEAGYDGSFGNKIVIDHNNGMRTLYAHLSSIHVSPGQTVEKGTQIGIMGTTGNSTGIHLHFEVHVNGAIKRPSDYF